MGRTLLHLSETDHDVLLRADSVGSFRIRPEAYVQVFYKGLKALFAVYSCTLSWWFSCRSPVSWQGLWDALLVFGSVSCVLLRCTSGGLVFEATDNYTCWSHELFLTNLSQQDATFTCGPKEAEHVPCDKVSLNFNPCFTPDQEAICVPFEMVY